MIFADKQLRRIAHFIRWSFELIVIWFFAFPETGVWTGVVLTLITIGIEFDHIDLKDWS
jgi:hypothetical protein